MSEFNIFFAVLVGVVSFTIGAVRIVRYLVEDRGTTTKLEALEQRLKRIEDRQERYEEMSYKESGNLIKDLIRQIIEK